ncbi:MAG: DUF429 domain-containing protein [Planctomycetota bacterium]
MPKRLPLVAVDYGSRTAGTTVLVHRDPHPDGPLAFVASAKKQDADALVADTLARLGPAAVFFDAPLSLPGVYRDLPGFDDFHHRRGDREVNAMSPMFLGGLTARAMKLAARFPDHHWHETYPAAQADRLGLPRGRYKKDPAALTEFTAALADHLDARFDPAAVTTWHHFDALLAYVAAERFASGQHRQIGDPAEGVIVV